MPLSYANASFFFLSSPDRETKVALLRCIFSDKMINTSATQSFFLFVFAAYLHFCEHIEKHRFCVSKSPSGVSKLKGGYGARIAGGDPKILGGVTGVLLLCSF